LPGTRHRDGCRNLLRSAHPLSPVGLSAWERAPDAVKPSAAAPPG
jgi:hypothetical protein